MESSFFPEGVAGATCPTPGRQFIVKEKLHDMTEIKSLLSLVETDLQKRGVARMH